MVSRKVSRRELLLTFGVVGGGLLLPPVLRAQTPSDDLKPAVASVPATAFGPSRDAKIAASGAQTLQTSVIQAPTRFTDMLLRWRKPDQAEPRFEVRVSSDGDEWSRWGTVTPDDPVHPEQDPNIVWSHPLYAGQSHFYQVRVKVPFDAGNAAAVLDTLEVHLVDANEDEPAQLTSSSGEVSASSLGQPRYVSRTGWGNPHGEVAPDASPDYYTATHLVVHHTADPNALRPGEPNWAARVRAIWSYHTHSLGWGDIGYNWLIDPNGVIYAGRAGSTDPKRDAVGFHDAANYGSMGVSIMGTYESVAPTAAAQNSLVNLLVWKAMQRSIDPYGRSYYHGCTFYGRCYNHNAGGIVANIAGHRQVLPGATACPGQRFFDLLPSIRQRVDQTIRANSRAQLISASLKTPMVNAGELVRVDFTIKNTGTFTLNTQAPEGGSGQNPLNGWVYDEADWYAGTGSSSAFGEQRYRLRATLGFSSDSARPPTQSGSTNLPWRWGLLSPLQPGETRTISGYVRFRTPGTYKLRANLVNELVGLYGADGTGSYIEIGTLTVMPERRAPAILTLSSNVLLQAEVYRLRALPTSLLARNDAYLSSIEGDFVGTFNWDGAGQAWGANGPLGLKDNFVVRQVRAFRAPALGTYRFRLTCDDGGWLWVDGKLVVDNGGLHGNKTVEGEIYLNAGLHILGVKMFELTGDAYVGYEWRPPGASSFTTIPRPNTAPRDGSRYGPGQQIVLAAHDMGGSGTTAIYYQINGGSVQRSSSALVPLSLGHGQQTVRYQAEDHNGNRSNWHTFTYSVDTLAPHSTLSAALRSNGIVDLSLGSPDLDWREFEVQARNTADGSLQTFKTKDRQMPFFGTPGVTYEFRVRASDGLNWSPFPATPQATVTVPQQVGFARVFIPRINR